MYHGGCGSFFIQRNGKYCSSCYVSLYYSPIKIVNPIEGKWIIYNGQNVGELVFSLLPWWVIRNCNYHPREHFWQMIADIPCEYILEVLYFKLHRSYEQNLVLKREIHHTKTRELDLLSVQREDLIWWRDR